MTMNRFGVLLFLSTGVLGSLNSFWAFLSPTWATIFTITYVLGTLMAMYEVLKNDK